eukprot:12882824-Alexandrium_andersonii.AAC.1
MEWGPARPRLPAGHRGTPAGQERNVSPPRGIRCASQPRQQRPNASPGGPPRAQKQGGAQ